MKETLIYQDNKTGQFKVLDNATKLGNFVMGDSAVVPVEEVLPKPRYAHAPHIIRAERREGIAKVFSYIYYNGYIAVAETKGRGEGPESPETSSGSGSPLQYKNYSLVRRLVTPDFSPMENKKPALRTDDEKTLLDNRDLGFLERKFFNPPKVETRTAEEKETMKLNFVLADNFFVFKGRAWFATRFKLWTGKLTDGKNFKGTIIQVQGVPRQDDPESPESSSGSGPTAFEARYHHILRVFIYTNNDVANNDVGRASSPPYYMITEEQVAKAPNQSASNSNFHVVLNEYTSTDLDTWTFSRVLAEDTNSAASSGLYAGYLRILKPAKYEHIKFDVLGGSQYQVTNLPVGYQRPKHHYFKITKEGRGDPADRPYIAYWTHALGDRQVYESSDGLAWSRKSVTIIGNKQGDILL